jgi:TBC1 domain family member 15
VPEATLGEALDAYVKVDLSDSASPPKTTVLVPAPPIAACSSSSWWLAV